MPHARTLLFDGITLKLRNVKYRRLHDCLHTKSQFYNRVKNYQRQKKSQHQQHHALRETFLDELLVPIVSPAVRLVLKFALYRYRSGATNTRVPYIQTYDLFVEKQTAKITRQFTHVGDRYASFDMICPLEIVHEFRMSTIRQTTMPPI